MSLGADKCGARPRPTQHQPSAWPRWGVSQLEVQSREPNQGQPPHSRGDERRWRTEDEDACRCCPLSRRDHGHQLLRQEHSGQTVPRRVSG